MLQNACLGLLSLLWCTAGMAENTSLTETRKKLHQLETQITGLQTTLHHQDDENKRLTQQLSMTEKSISNNVQRIRQMTYSLQQKQIRLDQLQQRINTLNQQVKTQQQLLTKHVRARYSMGEYQPLQWLLNQNNPDTTSRLLTYYQYLVKSRQKTITTIQDTKKKLVLNQKEWQEEMQQKKQLQEQLTQNQLALERVKHRNTTIIEALHKDIRNKQQELAEYKKNKETLSSLLTSLAKQSVWQTKHPLIYRNKRLPRPINAKEKSVQNLNQGVVFFAQEGTPVSAVFPGNIVFSDWLRGYGLLLIIDHGGGFMTLYAHNESLLKHKGDAVKGGETIATDGHSGGLKQNGLYFEIRQRGKAIPPLKWLS